MMGRIGVGLVIVAAASWTVWKFWSGTRKWVPIMVPVSLAKGARTETGDFEVNVSGPYEIAVEANRVPVASLNDLSCTLGLGAVWPEKNCPRPALLNVSWVLTSGGKTVARGSSEETRGGATTAVSAVRTIGYFQGRKGEHYRLTVDSLSDASSLATAKPQLRVSVGGTVYEFSLVIGSILSRAFVAIAAIGGMLILASLIVRRKRQVPATNPHY